MLIEVIATTLKEALDIEHAGADRIELVTGIKEGGLTPSLGLINAVCDSVKIPVNVMVRPHSKSFVYDNNDFQVVLNDIKDIKKTKANGIVFGSLTDEDKINFEQLQKVIDTKGHLNLTFHRAIDNTDDILNEFMKLIEYDIDTILTSAGVPRVVDNIELINKFVLLTKDKKVNILAGSGLNPDNLEEFMKNANVSEIHMGSGVKYDRDNFKEIDIETLSNTVKNT